MKSKRIIRDSKGRFVKGHHPPTEWKEGHPTWNKGLTRKQDKRILTYWLGKKRPETSKIISKLFKGQTKENSERVRKGSETKKKLYKEGKLIPINKIFLDKEAIIDMYCKKLFGIKKIAKIIGVSSTPIYRILKEEKIVTNQSARRKKLIKKKKISLNNCKKCGGYIGKGEHKCKVNSHKGKKGFVHQGSFFKGDPRHKDLNIRKKAQKRIKELLRKGLKRGNSEIMKRLIKEGKLNPYLNLKKFQREKGSWNKGLTKETDIRVKNNAKKTSDTLKEMRRRGDLITPKKDTSIEVKIQNYLKQLGMEFFTHQYIDINHGYQCDILIPSMDLVIECDGDYWHKYPVGNDIDHIRTKELLEKGFKVLRLWECEIKAMGINDFKIKLREFEDEI